MKTYWMRFGFGDPRTFTGLSPTFLFFENATGQTLPPPSIAEAYAGTGMYKFTWDSGISSPIAFLADAATTSPGTQGRYVVGSLDPSDAINETGQTLVAIGLTAIAIDIIYGTTNIALGTTGVAYGALNATLLNQVLSQGLTVVVAVGGIGSTTSSIGGISAMPGDLFGYMKRVLDNLEGDSTYFKASGVLDIYDRTGATLLAEKTIANSISTVVKS